MFGYLIRGVWVAGDIQIFLDSNTLKVLISSLYLAAIEKVPYVLLYTQKPFDKTYFWQGINFKDESAGKGRMIYRLSEYHKQYRKKC